MNYKDNFPYVDFTKVICIQLQEATTEIDRTFFTSSKRRFYLFYKFIVQVPGMTFCIHQSRLVPLKQGLSGRDTIDFERFK